MGPSDKNNVRSWHEAACHAVTVHQRSTDSFERGIAFSQQGDDGLTPIALNDFIFEVNRPPDAVFEAQPSANDGQMNVRMLIELGLVVCKGGPEFIGHGEGDVLPFAVG